MDIRRGYPHRQRTVRLGVLKVQWCNSARLSRRTIRACMRTPSRDRSARRIVVNIVNSILLLDLVLGEKNLDAAFLVATAHLCVELLKHVTSYWYNSSWMIGYDVQVPPLLSHLVK